MPNPPLDANQIKHLEMTQAIINRLAGNSFMIRGWSITLVSALLGFAFKDWKWPLVAVCFVPNFMFWALDAIYLLNERKFRWLSQKIVGGNAIPFDMSCEDAEKEPKNTYCDVFRSGTMLAFHGAMFLLIAASLAVMLYFGRPATEQQKASFSIYLKGPSYAVRDV